MSDTGAILNNVRELDRRPRRLLGYPDLRDLGIPYSRVHLDRREKAGTFPRRVHLGANRVAWREEEITAWLAALR
ncbi:MAG: helix-turn-helix transcriptional regulator [Stellaceae bacterium]